MDTKPISDQLVYFCLQRSNMAPQSFSKKDSQGADHLQTSVRIGDPNGVVIEGLVERCARIGEIFQQRLGELLDHPNVGDVRGRGLLAGIELVEDPESRRPFDRSLQIAETITEAAQAAGLVVWPSAGQADGTNGDLVLIAPPFIITEEEISELVHLFRIALDTATRSVKAQTGR